MRAHIAWTCCSFARRVDVLLRFARAMPALRVMLRTERCAGVPCEQAL